MVTLSCALVGVKGSAFPVTIDVNKLVGELKEEIEKKNKKTITCDARELELYLARKGDAWLTENEVKEGVHDTSDFEPLDVVGAPLNLVGLSEEDVRFQVTKEDVKAKKVPVHVLVVIPESVIGLGSNTEDMKQLMKASVSEVLQERDEKMSSFSISTCTRSKEGKLATRLGYKYSAIDVAEVKDESVNPFPWQENLAEDHKDQRTAYMQYFNDNLQGFLNQDERRTTPSRASPRLKPKYFLKDASQTKKLLDCDVPTRLPFKVKGTTDLMIIDETANKMGEVFAGLQFVIELKKDECDGKERCQILLELVAADLKSDKRCAPVGLLTTLKNYWYFLWFTPDREIARMTLTYPANGFKMMKELLKATNRPSPTGVFPMQIDFLALPLPKRQKLLEAAPAGDDAEAEMLERYELMSDELSPEFLQERKIEYAFRMLRKMPIHSSMCREKPIDSTVPEDLKT